MGEALNFITVNRVGENNIICFLEAFAISASLITDWRGEIISIIFDSTIGIRK